MIINIFIGHFWKIDLKVKTKVDYKNYNYIVIIIIYYNYMAETYLISLY